MQILFLSHFSNVCIFDKQIFFFSSPFIGFKQKIIRKRLSQAVSHLFVKLSSKYKQNQGKNKIKRNETKCKDTKYIFSD